MSKNEMPDLLKKMQFNLHDLKESSDESVELVDGHLLPRGTTTYIATDAGSGKSTSAIASCASASATGVWTFLGRKKHPKPLKTFVILGEDNRRTLSASFSSVSPETRAHLKTSYENGNLIISPYQNFSRTLDCKKIFDEKGLLTETGSKIFNAAREWKPDVIIMDTNTSLSEGDFLSKKESENATNACNDLADECNACVIVFMHLNRDGSSKLTKDSTAVDLVNQISGSIGIKNSTRHLLSFARAPEGKFDNLRKDMKEENELWMCGVKTNVIKDAANKIYPVIRDSELMVLRTYDSDPESNFELLGASDDAQEFTLQKFLNRRVPAIIQAASELRSPFAQSPRSKASLESLAGNFKEFLGEASPGQISKCLKRLETNGTIVACKSTRSGGSMVWDVRHGVYANEYEYEQLTGEKVPFRKGAPNVFDLENMAMDLMASGSEQEMEGERGASLKPAKEPEPESEERPEEESATP